MKTLLASTAIATLLALPAAAQSQSGSGASTAAPSGDQSQTLAVYDLNGDGVIDKADLKLADTNSDGVVDDQDEPQQKAADAGSMAPKAGAADSTGTDMAAGTDATKTPGATGSATDSTGTDMAAGTDATKTPGATGTAADSTGTGMAAGTDATKVPGATDNTGTGMAAGTDTAKAPGTGDNQAKVADLGADITGKRVYDSNDDWIGEVSEVVVSDSKTTTYAIIDVGGFLGIGEKPVALDVNQLDIQKNPDNGDVKISVAMTKDQLEAMPTYEKS